jgi:hypothetical protein
MMHLPSFVLVAQQVGRTAKETPIAFVDGMRLRQLGHKRFDYRWRWGWALGKG